MTCYRVAIPTLNRVKELGEKTLRTLELHGIPRDIIDIFVANEEQEGLYRAEYPEYNIVRGIIGKRAISNFIFQEYYAEGQYIVHFDDDIEAIRRAPPDLDRWSDDGSWSLRDEIDIAFSACEKSSRNLWGVYTCVNLLFMKNQDRISTDYKFCGGWMFGTINKRSSNECLIGDGCIDDYERCIRHYLADGGIVRLNYICCKTKYGNPEGGIGSIQGRARQESLDQLKESFPGLFYLKRKKDGQQNPILKDMR
tara:strand:- start:203 stop:961 length:759 start_codon:yes stop_codon:yes gene_type:complete